MPNPPAVASLEQEQAQQQTHAGKAELTKALEDTFPASDPVSMTVSSVLPGARAEDAERVRPNPDFADVVEKAAGNASTFVGDLRKLVMENPLTSVGVVAALAYIWGVTR